MGLLVDNYIKITIKKLFEENEQLQQELDKYIKEKAKESGMTPTEYIKAIKDFETKQQAEQEEAVIAKLC